MKVKTSELIGHALDWAVAECEGIATDKWGVAWVPMRGQERFNKRFEPSTSWLHGGPLIERESISIGKADGPDWWAFKDWKVEDGMPGLTPLIAAMRCYVARKMGDEVDIPKELMQ